VQFQASESTTIDYGPSAIHASTGRRQWTWRNSLGWAKG
jgi:hypothetical protein